MGASMSGAVTVIFTTYFPSAVTFEKLIGILTEVEVASSSFSPQLDKKRVKPMKVSVMKLKGLVIVFSFLLSHFAHSSSVIGRKSGRDIKKKLL
jgi:hypothetical protein